MQFRFQQVIDLPRAVLFAFHENPDHLLLLHRGRSRVRLIWHAGRICRGGKIWFEVTIARVLPVVLGFEHEVYEPPSRYGERLIHGPFSLFVHMHEFEEVDGRTVVRDLLDVRLPWYYGGDLALRWLVAPRLRRAFALRGAALLRLAREGEILRRVGRGAT